MMKQKDKLTTNRRDFVKTITIGGGAVFALGNLSFSSIVPYTSERKAIVCDFSKCTGCRTCETSCVAYNFSNKKGYENYGIVNPKNANIRVHTFNPDLDIPSTCSGCPDTPCITACPVTIDSTSGEKALYLNKKTSAIAVHEEECIGCGKCAKACESERTGVIRMHEERKLPVGLCTYCDGDPSCVKNCPYGALSYMKVDADYEFFGKTPEEIAEVLTDKFYKTGTSTN